MPTGSGKTKTCTESIIDVLRCKIPEEGYVLWFAHSKELCDQAYETLSDMWRFRGDSPLKFYRVFGNTSLDMGILGEKRAIVFLGFAKFHSILNSSKENERRFRTRVAAKSRLVIVDEAHKSMAPTYLKSIEYCLQNFNQSKLIGLTATPGRSNETSGENTFLSSYFGNNLIQIRDKDDLIQSDPIGYLQSEDVLASISSEVLEFELDVQISKREHSEHLTENEVVSVCNAAVINGHRNAQIVDKIKECLKDESTNSILVFAASTAHCTVLKMILQSHSIQAEVITGDTGKQLRQKSIEDFKNGKLKVLINYNVLSTGFDAPKLKTLIIARPISSKILGSQIIGRALRGKKNGGNSENKVIVLKDNISGFDPGFLFSYWNDFWNS